MNEFDSRQVVGILTRLTAGFMRVWIVALATLFLYAAAARADVTYCYTGHDFTTESGDITSGEATSDYLTGCVTLSEAITATSLTSYQSDAESISFQDHEGLITPFTSLSDILDLDFDVSGGAIQDWYVSFQTIGILETNNDGTVADFIDLGDHDASGAENLGDPGSWGEMSPTPEPATAVLWFTGIMLMIMTRKRIARVFRLDTGTNRLLSPH